MIVKDENIKVIRSDDFAEKSFTIQASAKAFKILSQGLYSNPHLAIVRELSANAFDSHVAAGNTDKKFDVHLPNYMEPYLSFRDYGVGLSKEDVDSIYTSYFTSTKTQSNDMVGCLGLGSKTPFSYTDSFSVTSFFNGKKYSYTAFINEQGFPAINLMNEEDTTEPNGMLIYIPVKTQDFSLFYAAATTAYNHYKVKPNITGYSIVFSNRKPVLENEDFALYAVSNSYVPKTYSVIMGNIAYPIDWGQLKNQNTKLIGNYSLLIKVDIGEVEVTASRESLEYSKTTKQSLESKLLKINAEIIKMFQQQIDAQKNWWDACILASQNPILAGSVASCKYQGNSLNTCISITKQMNLDVSKMYHLYNDNIKLSPNYDRDISIDLYTRFAICDLDKGGLPRLKQYMKNNKKAGKNHIFYLVSEDDAKKIQKMIPSYPDDLFVKTSALPKIARAKPTNSHQVYKFNENGYRLKDCWIEDPTTDITKGSECYVEISDFHPVDMHTETLKALLRKLRVLKHPVVVYGVKKKSIDKVSKNWIKFEDYIQKIIKQNEKMFATCVSLDKILSYRNILKIGDFLKNKSLQDAIDEVKYCVSNEATLRNCFSILRDIKKETSFPTKNIEADVFPYKQKYPLAFFVIENVSELPKKQIEDYIKLVDSNNP